MRMPTLLLLAGLAGCATIDTAVDSAVDTAAPIATAGVDMARDGARRAHRAATGPHLAPVTSPATIAGASPVVMPMPAMVQQTSAANSLWQAGARTFFNDQRATRVGDILTVKVLIDDSAQLDNSTTRTRSSNTEVGITSLFGKEEALGRILPPGGNFDPGSLIGAQGSSNAAGQGAISRKEKIELTLAATISQLLPNGNLVVVGKQEVRINGELRELTVAGIVRPEDVGADNSIRHDQMAEARISYGGRGSITAVQRPRWGQRVADAISPW
ncbi:MAG: flagellar basal body L-ring protein [Alphaproteobacteria bacterium]|nr:MAG: flagellar basal body L-ring protein [Caulobacteraceae bacterium]TPW08282.1 MAG: flagellar basal body L-ring protein [Alphaproteobacteria bacterium]